MTLEIVKQLRRKGVAKVKTEWQRSKASGRRYHEPSQQRTPAFRRENQPPVGRARLVVCLRNPDDEQPWAETYAAYYEVGAVANDLSRDSGGDVMALVARDVKLLDTISDLHRGDPSVKDAVGTVAASHASPMRIAMLNQ